MSIGIMLILAQFTMKKTIKNCPEKVSKYEAWFDATKPENYRLGLMSCYCDQPGSDSDFTEYQKYPYEEIYEAITQGNYDEEFDLALVPDITKYCNKWNSNPVTIFVIVLANLVFREYFNTMGKYEKHHTI